MDDTLKIFKIAQFLKEKGFDRECKVINIDNKLQLYPDMNAIAEWLRGVKNIHVGVDVNENGYYAYIRKINETWGDRFYIENPSNGGVWETHEEALEYGVTQALIMI